MSHGNERMRLSHKDVIGLVGDVDDSVIASILATGAEYSEVQQALAWLGVAPEDRSQEASGLTPIAERVYDILLSSTTLSTNEPPAH